MLFREITANATKVLAQKKRFYARLREVNPRWTERFLENYSRKNSNVKVLKEAIALELLEKKWVAIVTPELREGLIRYLQLLDCKDPRLNNRDSEITVGLPPSTASPSEGASGVQRLTESDFEQTSNEVFTAEASHFLKGGLPSPRTAVHAAVQRDDAMRALKETENSPVVLLHGPVAEGTSTILLQSAFLAVRSGRDVFSVEARCAEQAGTAIVGHRRPLVIIDDANLLKFPMSWSKALFDAGGCLLLGCQTRHLRGARQLFDGRIVTLLPVARVTLETAPAYIERIEKFAASDINDRGRIKSLFENGLTLGQGLGGLWPAQYQATRGTLLDRRVELLLEGEPEFLRAMSAVAFASFVSDRAGMRAMTRRIVRGLLEEIDLDDDAKLLAAQALNRLPRDLEGEFLYGFGAADFTTANDPPFEFRHPALTESIFRWIFGANDPQRGQFVFNKWAYFLPLVRALRKMRDNNRPSRSEVYSVLRYMREVHTFDLREGGELKRHALLDEEQPGDSVLRTIDGARSSFSPSLSDGGWFLGGLIY